MELMPIIIGYFKLCALCYDCRSKTVEYSLIIWGVSHIAVLTGISVVVLVYYESVFYIKDGVGAITDISQWAFPVLSHYVIIIESISKRRLGVQVWSKFEEIEKFLGTFNPNIYQQKQWAIRNYFIKIFITQLTCLSLEIYIMATIVNNLEWRRHWFASIFSFVATRSEHFFFTLMVDMMRHIMNTINLELINIGSSHQFSHLIIFKGDSRHKRLIILKKCYNRLWEISCLVEKCFAWSQFLNITSNFLCLTVNLYWNFVAIYFQSNPYWKESIMGTCPPLLTIAILLNSCEKCLRMSKSIGYHLHKIERNISNSEMNVLIQQFSMQILLEPIRFSILGFFNMDLDLLKSIIAAIATYLMIFIQFMPKNDIWDADWAKSQAN